MKPQNGLRKELISTRIPRRSVSMAEAHSAVAFSFTVTPDGVDVNLNHEAIRAVWYSGIRSWKKRIARLKNNFINGVYPASPLSWLFTVTLILALTLAKVDISMGLVGKLKGTPGVRNLDEPGRLYASCVLFATLLWLSVILIIRYMLKGLLSYHAWMFEPRGKMTLKSKMWLVLTKVLVGRKPLLYSYQGSLPKQPVPSLDGTMERYLLSVQPLMDEEQYKRMEKLVEEFRTGIGPRLQRYLNLKSWWATNYISDWWEEYVYLRGRSPIMVNSNFYGIDAVFRHPTNIQVARAANIIYAMLQFRRSISREELKPVMANKTVPLCSWQYERLFNTTRIPGVETDKLVHWNDSTHIAVYHRGRYFKVYIHSKGKLLTPAQIEVTLQQLVENTDTPQAGEEHLAALTAGDRIPWAKARTDFFSKGVNKTSLDAIEKAAFVVALDDDPQDFDLEDQDKVDKYTCAMLYGKCYDRWFDKTFTLVVCSNGRIGFNAEHSWADAPIMAHLWESIICDDVTTEGADAPIMAHLWESIISYDFDSSRADAPIMGHLWESAVVDELLMGYREDGHTRGEVPENAKPPNPIRLQWDIPEECCNIIENSLTVARGLAADVDMHLMMHTAYGKGFMKKCDMSPDAYIQLALQLAYFRNAGKFSLTYEASMTRFFREGRTETVRSCTNESVAFARSMDDKSKSEEQRKELIRAAAEQHQQSYRLAMTGKGIDRHLFCLYVVSKYLGIDSPFLKEVLSEPWRLSTSQTPHNQTDKLDLKENPQLISAGGGFGPVADDGYGVSYIIAGEDTIFFHISCKKSCNTTNSRKFGADITKALDDMRKLLQKK